MSVSYPVTALASTSRTIIVASGNHLHVVILAQDGSSSETTLTLPLPPAKSKGLNIVRHAAISPTDTHIVAVTEDKAIALYSLPDGQLLNTRYAMKKCSDVGFAPDGSILYSDMVGDVYSYPLQPRSASTEGEGEGSKANEKPKPKPSSLAIQSDPTLNPDASLVLGHVSIVTQTTITPDARYIISTDRDEHIRVSRYPNAYVIDRYLFGSDGFVSAIHLLQSRPEILLSAGGERWLRLWDWKSGKEVGRVDVMAGMLSYRKARAAMRVDKKAVKAKAKATRTVAEMNGTEGIAGDGGAAVVGVAADVNTNGNAQASSSTLDMPEQEDGATFCSAPDGWQLPTGQGLCVKKIESVVIGDTTVVLFFSEGASAIHSFTLSSNLTPTEIVSHPFDYPILDFCLLPPTTESPQIFVSLDTAFDTLKTNIGPNAPTLPPVSTEKRNQMSIDTVVLSISSSGLDDTTPPPSPVSALQKSLKSPPNLASDDILSKLELYPLLSLLPKWVGMEEDDSAGGTTGDAPGDVQSEAGTAFTSGSVFGPGAVRNYTPEELAKMSKKQLGRLKSKGLDVAALMWGRKKEGRAIGKVHKAQAQAQGAQGGVVERKGQVKKRKIEDVAAGAVAVVEEEEEEASANSAE